MNRIGHLYFDLDHTLWDFDENARAVLSELYVELDLGALLSVPFEAFLAHYSAVNEALWDRYRLGQLGRDEVRLLRFRDSLAALGLPDSTESARLAARLDAEFMHRAPRQTRLVEGAIELLEAVSRRYRVHILTNGFPDTQNLKIDGSGIAPYIEHRISSADIGVLKPDRRIFLHALRKAGAKRRDALMIGDHLVADVIGARNAGIEAVYFNPQAKPHGEKLRFEVRRLRDIADIIGV